jgi:hypothetical protein
VKYFGVVFDKYLSLESFVDAKCCNAFFYKVKAGQKNNEERNIEENINDNEMNLDNVVEDTNKYEINVGNVETRFFFLSYAVVSQPINSDLCDLMKFREAPMELSFWAFL